MSLKISKTEFKKDVMDNCRRLFRKELDEATPQEQYQSVSYAVKDMIVENYEKSIFPLVGGLGTLFAVIAGLLAMGLALLKRKKDMKNEA